MSGATRLGVIRDSRAVDDFSFAVSRESMPKVFKNSYVILHPEDDPSAVTLARVVNLETNPRIRYYLARCRVLMTLDREKNPKSLLRPMHRGMPVLLPTKEQMQDFFRTSEPSLTLGRVSGFPKVKFPIPLEDFRRTPCLIAGMTGSGKTSTVLKISKELAARRFSNLIFDFYGEYRENLENQATVLVPGTDFTLLFDDDFLSAFSEFAELSADDVGVLYQVSAHYRNDIDGLLDALRMEATRERLVSRARRYRRIESHLIALHRAGILLRKDVETREMPLEPGITILDLSELPLDYQPLLINYTLTYSLSRAKSGLGNPVFIVLEEAHRFIPAKGRQQIPVVKDVVLIGRKYGISLCSVTQKPSFCDPTLLANCGLQLIHTLRNRSDLQALTEISEYIEASYIEEMSKLAVGEVLVFGPKIRFPAIVRIS